MFGVDTTPNLCFATKAGTITAHLENQIRNFFREHPDTRLVIIDTLQIVRDDDGNISYACKLYGRIDICKDPLARWWAKAP